MEEGDKAHGSEVEVAKRQEVEDSSIGIPKRTSTLSLKLELKISPSLGTGLQQFASASYDPVNVTVEYPDDIQVSVNAIVLKSDGNPISQMPLAIQQTVGTGTQQSFNTVPECARCTHIEKENVKTRASQSILKKHRSAQSAAAGDNIFPGDVEESSETEEELDHQARILRHYRMDSIQDDSSIYHSVLAGNESIFGDISMINHPPTNPRITTSDMFSVNVNVDSQEDLESPNEDEDEQDGLYPDLPPRDFIDEEFSKRNKHAGQGEDVTGPTGRVEGQFEEKEVDEKEEKETMATVDAPPAFEITQEDKDELRQVLDDLIDKIEPDVKQTKPKIPPDVKQKKPKIPPKSKTIKAKGAIASLMTEIPVKSKKYVTTGRVTVRRYNEYGNASEDEIKDFEDETIDLFGEQEKGRGGINGAPSASIFTLKSSSKVGKEKDNTEGKPSLCNHVKTQHHACHICLPVPEELIGLMEKSSTLSSTEARKIAFIQLRYLKENQHTEGVRLLMKYISGLGFEGTSKKSRVIAPSEGGNVLTSFEGTDERVKGRFIAPVAAEQPLPTAHVAYTKERKFKNLIQSVIKQNGAFGVFEDEEIILEQFAQLNDYLTTLEKHSIKKMLREDCYESVKGLCLYFALERRWFVRSELLETLDLLATKDSSSFSILISSDLPVDLAKSIEHEFVMNDGGQERMLCYAEVLYTLISTGSPLQVDHLERINADFIYCLIQISDGNMKGGCSAILRDLAVNIILAYNLQFSEKEIYMNKVLAALSVVKEADYLKQKMLIHILNRDVSNFHNQKLSHPSLACYLVVKLASDILNCGKTAGFFIDSDLNILFAALGSYIPELETGDWKRTAALRLTRKILRQLDYQHNGFRRMISTIKGILTESESESALDQKIARKIARELDQSRPSRRNTAM